MRYTLSIEDTEKGIRIQVHAAPNGVTDSRDSLSTLHAGRILQEFKLQRDAGLINCNPIKL